MVVLEFIILVTIGYLLGSVSSAIIVSDIFSLPNPRKEGSQNPGATNVLRLGGKKYAAIVMLFDVLKGFLPVLLAHIVNAPLATIAFTAFAAVLGHLYPIFFQFKGGKGVATTLGALIALQIGLGVSVAITWILVAHFTRYSSLSSIVAIFAMPFYSLFLGNSLDIFLPLFFITILVVYKHRNNITRLMDGKEPKLNMPAITHKVNQTFSFSDSSKEKFEPKTAKATVKKKTTSKAKGKTATKTTSSKKATSKAKKETDKTDKKPTKPKKTATASKKTEKTKTAKKDKSK